MAPPTVSAARQATSGLPSAVEIDCIQQATSAIKLLQLDLVLALNAGLPGMCTLHANSAREALVKMCTLPLLAGENISDRFVVPTVATSVDLVVHLGLDPRGHRQVEEVMAVPGRVEGGVIECEPVFVRRGGELRRAHGSPPRPERFERVGLDLRHLLGEAA